MKQIVAAILTILLLLFCWPAHAQEEAEDEITVSGMTEEELSEALDRWRYDYVRYLITGWEEDEWGKLETNRQKLEFIEYFWLARDPDIKTPENEFRQEYRNRWNYVNQHFTAGKHGWRTDRGRIYLTLGPPQDVQRNPMGRNRSERPSEIWYYNMVANERLPAQIEIAFVDFMGYGDYEIVSDLERTAKAFSYRFGISMNNLDAYALRRAGETTLSEDEIVSRLFDESVIRNPEVLSRELFDLQDELRYVAEVPHLMVKKASERVRTEIINTELTFSMTAAQLPGGENAILPVTLAIPLNNVSYVEDPRTGRTYQVSIYARLHGKEENMTFEDELNIPVAKEILEDPERAGILENYVYQFLFTPPPGEYTLSVTLRDVLSKNIGFAKETLILDGEIDQLHLSDIIFADLVAPIQNIPGEQLNTVAPFKIADRRVIPNVGKRIDIDQKQEFFLYYYVTNFNISPETGKPDLEVVYYIYRDGALISKTPVVRVQSQTQNRAAVESRFTTRALGVGSFRILVEVTDTLSGDTAKQSVEFRIVKGNVVD